MSINTGYKLIFLTFLLFQQLINQAFGFIPHPDHVVVVIFENHAKSAMIGNPAAPYINSLINDNRTATFTQSFALSHPSQPNYLQLFCGADQGVRDDAFPANLPFEAPNLGAELLQASKTFIGYSEDQPSVGYTGGASGKYRRKHNPWVNWQGSTINGIPAGLNQTFTSFPTDFTQLPSVAFVIPNIDNDMHDGTDPDRITLGDTWLQNNLGAYIEWAKQNNSLLILTFDEDNGGSQNNILTMFTGQMVQGGSYPNHIDHYNVLHVIEDMFDLPHAGSSEVATTIDYCWDACYQPATITPPGPLSYCLGSTVELSASSGDTYLWSNGATTPTISVTSSGDYSVTVTNNSNCTSTSSEVSVSISSFPPDGFMFSESMGVVSANTAITTHENNNGFDYDNYTMSGSGELRVTIPSQGYAGSSGGANIYLTNTPGKNFIISGINTSEQTNLELSFGIYKNRVAASGSDLIVSISTDGANFIPYSYTPLPTGSGTAIWVSRTISGVPASSNLSIQFEQTDILTQYRIDDVTVKYAPSTLKISASGATSLCQGGSVSLQSSHAVSYTWSTGATTQNINVATSGNYYVTGTYASGCILTSNVIPVTIHPNVTPTITIVADHSGTVCSGTNVTFTAEPFNGGWAPLYQWKRNGNNVGTNEEFYSTTNLADNNTITCTLTSNATCATINTVTSNGITLDVDPSYTPSVSISSNLGNSVCAGNNVIFTATPVNGGATPTYQWKLNNVNVGSNSNSFSDNSVLNGDVISCSMTTSLTSCVTAPTVTSNSIVMTVNLNYSPAVTIVSDGSDTICPGVNLNFTATPFDGGGTPVYQWKKNGVNVGTNSVNYSDNTFANGDSLVCVMTSSITCANPASAVSNYKKITVLPSVTPSVTIAVNPTGSVCPGANLTFTATPVNQGNTPAYQWKRNGTNVGPNASVYSDNTLSNNDAITCSMTSSVPCFTSNPATSNSVTVSLIPAASILNFNPSSGPVGTSVIIIGNNFNGITAVSFNGLPSSFTVNHSSQITAVVPGNATTGKISITTNCGTILSASNYTVTTPSVTLNLKLFIEGYYIGGGQMKSVVSAGISEAVTIELHNNVSPFNLLFSANGNINTSGNGSFTFPAAVNNHSYYIVVVNPNTLKTWSSSEVLFGSVTNYDFSTAASKAFGSNQKNLGDGNFAFYSGDVNQDGQININDLDKIKSSIQLFLSGYLADDLTGDKLIESADFSLVENNIGKLIAKP